MPEALRAFQTVVTFVVGHTLSTHATIPNEERSRAAYDQIADLPALAESAGAIANNDVDAEFEFGLDCVVRGLEAKLAET